MSSTDNPADNTSSEPSEGSTEPARCPLENVADPTLRKMLEAHAEVKDADLSQLISISAPPHNVPGKINSLAGLECAGELSELKLDRQRIANLGPLRSLEKLTKLRLQGNPCHIAELKRALGTRLPFLKELAYSMHDSETDVQWLGQLNAIETVSLSGKGVTDAVLAPLLRQPSLSTLELTKVGAFDDAQLRKNCLSKENSPGPAGCAKLGRLTVTHAALRDLEWLPETGRLRWLDVRENAIESIGPITRARGLTHVFLDRNAIESLEPLRSLKTLELVRVDGNKRLSDLSPIAKLPRLVFLQAVKCAVQDLSSLVENKSLRDIRLQDNEISDVTALGELKELVVLWLHGNKIKSIDPLKTLTKMKSLRVSSNSELSSIEAVAGMMQMSRFEAHGCRLSSVEPLVNLVEKGALRQIVLTNNPKALCEHPSMKKLLALKKHSPIGKQLFLKTDCD